MSVKWLAVLALGGALWLGPGSGPVWPSAPYTAVVSVTITTEKTVPGPRVRLGEVAFIEELDPAGRDLAQALDQLDLGPAPAPGRTTVLRRDQLKKIILDSGLETRSAAWNFPPELRVTAAALDGATPAGTEEELRAALEKHLAATEPYQSGRFEILGFSLAPPPELPPGPVTVRYQPQVTSNPTLASGHFVYSQDGRDVGRRRVTAQVDLSVTGLVAARTLPRGHVLAESDLSLTLVPWNQARGLVIDPALAVGAALKTSLVAGEPLRDRALGKNILVRRGDLVTLQAGQGNLSATTQAEAREDGALGDTITVTNVVSKKNVRGRITGPGRVEVIY